MKICVLVHGIEAFYSKEIESVVEKLKEIGEIEIYVTGTMARTASIDSDLAVEVWEGLPSELFKSLEKKFDLFLIASYSKSPESGYAFGEIIFNRSKVSKPVLQLELSNKTAIIWNGNFHSILEKIGFKTLELIIDEKLVWNDGKRTYRRVLATEPGELLLIDGIVVGRVREKEVLLVSEDGEILELQGVDVKQHGLEKLRKKYPKIDLEKIRICSLKGFKSVKATIKGSRGKGTAFIDHSAYEIYEFAGDCEGAVCIGDDTTAIAGEILFRFDTPILGIVDGDRDSVVKKANIHPESELFIVKSDDLAGKLIFERVFESRDFIMDCFANIKRKIEPLLLNEGLLISKGEMKEDEF